MEERHPAHVVVIGGGVSGLTAAYRLRALAESGVPVAVTIIERDARLGGKIWTERVVDRSGRELVLDGGSDSYLSSKRAVAVLADELGIAGRIVGTNDANRGTFIVKAGRLLPLVDGMMMFAPTKVIPLVTSALYSWSGKVRMGLDLILPRKHQPATGPEDESLESLVVRRLGRECLDRVAEPLVGGVNGSDPRSMSVLATYPMLLDMEQRYGSLIRGFLAQRKSREASSGPHSGPRSTMFSSFAGGLGEFTDALAARIGAKHTLLGASVVGIQRDEPNPDSYLVSLDTGESLVADGIIVATESWAATALIRPLDSEAASIVEAIPDSSCATVLIALNASDFTYPTNWHGALTPAVEGLHVTGISLVTSKWQDRAPDDTIVLRCFVGGARDASVLAESDERIIQIAREAYRDLLGVPLSAPSTFERVFRFERGMPQYTVGHLDRMAELDCRTAALRGVALAGGAYRGVGVPNCVESGEAAVAKVLVDLGVDTCPPPVSEAGACR